jgi:hypothetical protein
MERRKVVFAVVGLAVVLAGPARAEDLGVRTLDEPSDTAPWSGEFVAGASPDAVSGPLAAVGGLPVPPLDTLLPQCTSAICDVLTLNVALAPGVWTAGAGGMLVQIQWPSVDAGWDLELFVYGPDGSLVAQGTTWAFSQTEAVWLPNPANGTYTVVVEPNTVVGQPVAPNVLTPLDYEGFVEFERGTTITRQELNNDQPYTRQFVNFGVASTSGPVELLPDIVPTKPGNFHIETGAGAQYYLYMDRGLRHPPSCYPLETLGATADEPSPGTGPTRCLRWDQGEYNFGDGPFELHIYTGQGDGTDAYQRVYKSDGTIAQYGPLGTVEFSQAHGHFHYQGWQTIKLYRLNPDGTLGEEVSVGVDKGICMVDILNAYFGDPEEENSPHGYEVPGTCDNATHSDPNDPTFPSQKFFQMGISVGYADLYPWFIADQFIDITSVPDGRYALVVDQDVFGRIHEKKTENNRDVGCVEIIGDVATDIDCAPPSP